MLSWWFGTNWFQMKKISATQTGEGPLVFSFSVLRRISLSPENPSCPPRTAKTATFFGGRTSGRASWKFEIGLDRNASAGERPVFCRPLRLLLLPVHLRLALSPSCYEGHQASGGAGPQEESKRASPCPPPSYRFFITYYLCLTDLLQTNGCHMEKEKQGRRKEGRKKLSPCVLYLPVASLSFSL